MPTTNGQLTSLDSVNTFATSGGTVDVPEDAVGVLLQAESQQVRIRTDGTDPTTTVGLVLYPGDTPYPIFGQAAMRQLKAIEVAASAKLNYAFMVS